MKAETITDTTDNAVHNISQTIITSGQVFGSVYVQDVDTGYAAITLEDQAGTFLSLVINLSTGASAGVANTGGLTNVSKAIISTDSWYRLVIGANFSSATTLTLTVSLMDGAGTGNRADYAYTGTGTSIYAWGAQITSLDIPFVGGSPNLLSYPEQLDQWTANNVTVTANSVASPNIDPNFIAVPDSTFTTETISNSTASTDSTNRYNICQRTGFKVKAGGLLTEWNGTKVRPDSYEPRNAQDFVSARAELLDGPQRPEPADVFITTSVAPETL